MQIERWTALSESASELLFLDPGVFNGTPTLGAKAIPGLQYPLPPIGNEMALRSVAAVPGGEWYDVSSELLGPGIAGPVELATVDELAFWSLTLVSPSGQVLHKDIPLRLLVRNRSFPVYFAPGTLVDARQCYLTCSSDGDLTSVVCLRFIYAR